MKTLHLIDLDFTMVTYSYAKISALNQGLILDALLIDNNPEKNLFFDSNTETFILQNEALKACSELARSGTVYDSVRGKKENMLSYISMKLPHLKDYSAENQKDAIVKLVNDLKLHSSEMFLISSHWKSMYFSLMIYIKDIWDKFKNNKTKELSEEEIKWTIKLTNKYETFKDVLIKGLDLWNCSASTVLTVALDVIKKNPWVYVSNTDEIKRSLAVIEETKRQNKDHIFVLLTASVSSYVKSIMSNFLKDKLEDFFHFNAIFASKPFFYDLHNTTEFECTEEYRNFYTKGSFNELLKKLNLRLSQIKNVFLYEDALVAGIILPPLMNKYITPVFIDRFEDKKNLDFESFKDRKDSLISKDIQIFEDFEKAIKYNISNN